MDSSEYSNNPRRITMRIAVTVSAILTASLLGSPMSASAQGQDLELVSDINSQVVRGATVTYFPERAQVVGGFFFFAADADGSGSTGQRFDTELWKSDGTETGTVRVKDINPTGHSFPENMLAIGNVIYFVANDGTHGKELWKSDGTAAGTSLVKDIFSGAENSDPSYLTEFNGDLYFSANDGIHGVELWKSDGTAAGTVQVKDIRNGASGSDPSYLQQLNGQLYFSADDGVNGRELWKSNGIDAGTAIVKDISPGSNSGCACDIVVVGPTLLFRADGGSHGVELWKSDGTADGTVMVKDLLPGNARTGAPRYGALLSGSPTNFAVLGEKVFFRAYSPKPNDVYNELYSQFWVTDGTETGTVQLTNSPGGYGSGISAYSLTGVGGEMFFLDISTTPSVLWKSDGTETNTVTVQDPAGQSLNDKSFLTELNEQLFFSARRGSNEASLWRVDSNGPVEVANQFPSASGESYRIRDFFAFKSKLFFSVSVGNYWGNELWVSDGSASGTKRIVNINDTTDKSVSDYGFETFTHNGHLYFAANDGISGNELWRLNLATGLVNQVDDFESGSRSSNPANFVLFNSAFLFTSNSISDGIQLRISQGETSTVLGSFEEIERGIVVRNTYYFSADDGNNGLELWRSDGTETGTVLVKDISSGSSSAPTHLFGLGNLLYFSADDGNSGSELWKSDGTSVGTVKVKDINPMSQGADGSSPANLVAIGSHLYFTATDGVNGQELWRSDGTEAGTMMVKDINVQDPWNDGPKQILTLANTIYFTADDGNSGRELWRSDGTDTGTVMVKDIDERISWGSAPEDIMLMGSVLYFSANDGENGRELWTSNGTETGTVMVRDIDGSPWGNGSPLNLTVFQGTLFFTAYDGFNGRELWRSDGTMAGTVLVSNINPQPSTGSSPQNLTAIGSLLYFVADNGSNGPELWFTSGDDVTLVSDLFPGAVGSNPVVIIDGGHTVYFAADNGRFGYEWWQIGLGAVATSTSPVTPAPSPSTPVNQSIPTASGPAQATPTPTASPTPSVTPTPSPTPASTVIGRLSVSGFAGDSSRLNSRQLTLIRSGIATHRDVRQVVCTGFTSGRSVTPAARRLASARAQAVCRALSVQKPSVVTRIEVSPAKGLGAKFRRVDVQFIR